MEEVSGFRILGLSQRAQCKAHQTRLHGGAGMGALIGNTTQLSSNEDMTERIGVLQIIIKQKMRTILDDWSENETYISR